MLYLFVYSSGVCTNILTCKGKKNNTTFIFHCVGLPAHSCSVTSITTAPIDRAGDMTAADLSVSLETRRITQKQPIQTWVQMERIERNTFIYFFCEKQQQRGLRSLFQNATFPATSLQSQRTTISNSEKRGGNTHRRAASHHHIIVHKDCLLVFIYLL